MALITGNNIVAIIFKTSALKKKIQDSKAAPLMERDKRILQELRSLHCDPHPYCSIFPSESDFSKCLFCHEKVSAQQRLHILEYINRFPFIMLLHRLFLYFQRHILVHRLAVILERSVSHHNVQCLETDQTLLCNVLLL